MSTSFLASLILARVGRLRRRTGGPRAESKPARLVTFDELQKRLGEPGLRLLDARPRADYDKGHIPGAVWVDAKAVETMAAKPGGLADRAAWESWIAPLGIGPETEVLVYDANRQLDAARLWWLLGYLGVEKVGLIDGNFPLWAEQGRPVTDRGPDGRAQAVRGRLPRRPARDQGRGPRGHPREVGRASSTPGATGEYTGDGEALEAGRARPDGLPASSGTNLVDKDGRFLDESALRAKLAKAGVKPGEPVITHCQGGRPGLGRTPSSSNGSASRRGTTTSAGPTGGTPSDTPDRDRAGSRPKE